MPAMQTISPRADLKDDVFDGVVLVDLGGDRQALDVQHDLAAGLQRAFFRRGS